MKETWKARVAFLGGKPLGYEVLTFLTETENVVCVFTNEDDYKSHWYSSVKTIADELDIPYITTNINFQERNLEYYSPDFVVCHGYDTILKKGAISVPKYGAFNIHTGLAEEYRGCYPTLFPILDGKEQAGVTLHEMTTEVDAGDIYGQAKVAVQPTDTAESLYYKCAGVGVEMFKKVWPELKKGNAEHRPQVATENTRYIKKSDFPSLEIDLTWEADKIDRYVRALTFNPFPKPYFVIGGKKYEINYRGNNHE
jgi:methionyl-tRNA formyltransferase